MENQSKFGLQELLNDFPKERFLAEHWRANKAFVTHAPLERLQAPDVLSELLELDTFASQYHGRVSMIHPDGRAIDVYAGSEALPYLKQGFTVYFRHIEKYFPKLNAVLDRLVEDTGMPRNEFTAEIFTSEGLSGVPMHCDYDYNLSLLLAGEKTWTFAENTGIRNQTSIFMPANREQIEPGQLEYITDEPQLSEMPSTAVSETLRPGSLIFMPRGWWHSTHSVGRCLCVNLVMKGPHWARLVSQGLEKELLHNASWRAYPYDVARTDGTENAPVTQLAELIGKLKRDWSGQSDTEIARSLIKNYLKK